MSGVRWRKIAADLRTNKTRTLLTTVTIAVGVFAVGFVSSMKVIMEHDLDADYESVNPHSAIIYCEPFDDGLLSAVERVPGVGQVDGRSQLTAHVVIGADRKTPVQIIAVPPLREMRVDRLRPSVPGGSIMLADRELLLERSGLIAVPFQEGEISEIELPGGVTREMRVAGFVHDPTIFPYMFMGYVTAYITPETMVWLDGSRDYNQMLITVSERPRDKVHVAAVAQAAADRIEQSGRQVFQTFMYKPGRHFAADIGQAMMAILFVLGLLAVLLGAFLVVNTVMALLAQHTRQIGIMKAIGGDTFQIARMYVGLVFVFGVLSLLLAVPLAACAAYGVSRQMMSIINVEPGPFRVPLQSVLWQIAVALVSPVAATLAPVLNSAHVTVREALNDYGIGKARFGESGLDRVMARMRLLSRPLLLSLRNTFRRGLRLALTLSTLTLGGAIFISVFNLWSALDVAVVQLEGYLLADVNVSLDHVSHFQRLEPLVMSVPGAMAAEGWSTARAQVLSGDGSPAVEITILAPPSRSTLIRPVLTAGRWLVPGDQNAIVIGNHLLKERPDLNVGDDVTIKLNDEEHIWRIVGIYKMAGNAATPRVYANYEYFSRLTNQVGLVSELHVTTSPQDAETQAQVARALEVTLQRAGIPVTQVDTGLAFRARHTAVFGMIAYFLLAMALMIACVGGLGLMGMMGINVLERTREIGVMRAVGASGRQIAQIVVAEGMFIGIISWILGALLSVPVTQALNSGVGAAMLTVPLDFTFGWNGLVGWLVGILALSALASLWPSLRATRVSVRESLAYE